MNQQDNNRKKTGAKKHTSDPSEDKKKQLNIYGLVLGCFLLLTNDMEPCRGVK